jgi:bifunctional non-homologous end joining protein LigD
VPFQQHIKGSPSSFAIHSTEALHRFQYVYSKSPKIPSGITSTGLALHPRRCKSAESHSQDRIELEGKEFCAGFSRSAVRRRSMPMPLDEYRRKRDFKVTPEPSGSHRTGRAKATHLLYMIHKHRASHLHYDLRLEWNGVLLSWAVPKGPSVDPSIKRLAMQVEDHPVEYANFEGVIPQDEYGGGTVMVWDKGTWEPESTEVDAALQQGDLKFTLDGTKLKGSWVLVRTRGYGSSPGRSSWLLIKHRDEYASKRDITLEEPYSAVTHRLLADIARDHGGNVDQAATGDPPVKKEPRAAKVTATRRKSPRKYA